MNQEQQHIFKFATFNIEGIISNHYNKINNLLELITKNNFHFIALQETWLKPGRNLGPLEKLIVIDLREPAVNRGRQTGGICVFRHPTLTTESDFEPLEIDLKHRFLWFKFRNFHIGVFYLTPHISKTEYADALSSAVKYRRQHRKIILTGDFNTRLGPIVGDSAAGITTHRKKRILTDFISNTNLDIIQPNLNDQTEPFRTFIGSPDKAQNRERSSVIDYVIASNLISYFFDPINIIKDQTVESDHRSIYTTVHFTTNKTPIKKSSYRYKIGKLKFVGDNSYRKQYIARFREAQDDIQMEIIDQLSNITHSTTSPITTKDAKKIINKAWNIITRTIDLIAKDIIGIGPAETPFTDPSWTSDLQRLHKERKKAYKKKAEARSREEIRIATSNLKKARSKLRKAYKKNSKSNFYKWTEKLFSLPNSDALKMLSSTKRKRQRKLNSSTLKSDQETLEETINVFDQMSASKNRPAHQDVPPEPPPKPPDFPKSFNQYTKLLIGFDSIAAAIKALPNNKAPGSDKIRSEMLKPIANTLGLWCAPIFNAILQVGEVPSEWNNIIICPIWKGKGLPSDPEKHRPICLAQTFRKVFERTILKHLTESAGDFQTPQGGFRSQRSTFDQAATLDFLVKKIKKDNNNNDHWILFLDIKGAFPSTYRQKLWEKLERKEKMDPAFLKVLTALQDEVYIQTVIGGNISSKRWMERGLTQGTVLSPILWNYFIDDLIDILKAITDNQHRSPFFVDDIASVARNAQQAQQILDAAERWSIENEVTFEPSKCEAICGAGDTLQQLNIYNQPLTNTNQFKYLGIMFDKDGINAESTATKQINATITRLSQLQSHGINGVSCATQSSILFYKSFLRPVMEYGMQLGVYSEEITHQFEKTQLRCLRSLLSVNSSTTQRGMRLISGLTRMTVRYQILACRTWSRWFDRKEDNDYYSSTAIDLFDKIDHHITIKTMPLWIQMENRLSIQPLSNLFAIMQIKSIPNPQPGQNQIRVPTLIESFSIADMEEQNLEKNQELARAITPSLKPAAILSAGQPTISRTSRRRLLLWRLGQIPGHIPDVTHRRCEKCYQEQDLVVAASRRHVHECLNLDPWINPLIQEFRPPNNTWTPPNHPNVYTFDNLLDLLTFVPKCPPEPLLMPGTNKDEDELYQEWLDQVNEINNQERAIWIHVVSIIDSICSQILGWPSDPFLELDPDQRV